MKIKFFYSHDINTKKNKHTATDVVKHTKPENVFDVFKYRVEKYQDNILVHSEYEVPMDDVLYIEIVHENGVVVTIPGLVKKFKVLPNELQVKQIIEEEERIKVLDAKIAKNKERNKKKSAKYRKAQYAKKLGVTVEQLENLHKN